MSHCLLTRFLLITGYIIGVKKNYNKTPFYSHIQMRILQKKKHLRKTSWVPMDNSKFHEGFMKGCIGLDPGTEL